VSRRHDFSDDEDGEPTARKINMDERTASDGEALDEHAEESSEDEESWGIACPRCTLVSGSNAKVCIGCGDAFDGPAAQDAPLDDDAIDEAGPPSERAGDADLAADAPRVAACASRSEGAAPGKRRTRGERAAPPAKRRCDEAPRTKKPHTAAKSKRPQREQDQAAGQTSKKHRTRDRAGP
jgi:hypothetical protein